VPNGADYFQYRLAIEKEGKKHTVEVSDPSVLHTAGLASILSKYRRDYWSFI